MTAALTSIFFAITGAIIEIAIFNHLGQSIRNVFRRPSQKIRGSQVHWKNLLVGYTTFIGFFGLIFIIHTIFF